MTLGNAAVGPELSDVVDQDLPGIAPLPGCRVLLEFEKDDKLEIFWVHELRLVLRVLVPCCLSTKALAL